MTIHGCPIFKSRRVIQEWALHSDEILNRLSDEWQVSQLSGDAIQNLKNAGLVTHFICLDCDCGYWYPVVPGDGKFYESISHTYVAKRWDKSEVRKAIRPNYSIIDVGAGPNPIFLGLRGVNPSHSVAIDENPIVYESAQRNGFKIQRSLAEVTSDSRLFDHAVALHFLEHIPDPLEFFKQLIELLQPDGRLWISTPNRDRSYRALPFESFDVPPHHLTTWNKRSLENFIALLGFKIEAFWISKPVAVDTLGYRIKWKLGFRSEYQRIRAIKFRSINPDKYKGNQILIKCKRAK